MATAVVHPSKSAKVVKAVAGRCFDHVFATLIFFAIRSRSNPATHKRLILIATIGLSIAAIARWPMFHRTPGRGALISYIFLLMLVAYDLWSTHKIHRATLWAGAFVIFVQQIRLPLGHTSAWHTFASWVQALGR
jgi:FtsH-binding integral membrane protein